MADKKVSVLVVDDEAVIRKLLKQTLTVEGYECREAGNANQALEELQNNRIELVILDIKMPGKSGVQLLSELRASYPDTMVVMATAITETSTAIHCMRLGAYDYITKPFNLDEVVLSIGRALEKRRLVLENRDYQQHLEQKVEEQAKKIRASFLNAITSLAYALEAKDNYTSGHSQRVAEMSVATAEELGMSPESVEKIRLAGLIHDIGKIGVRESVLNKPGQLTDEEFQHIKYHCEIGEHILAPIVEDEEILKMVRHHHERYDGTGYPDGLSREKIPLGAKILSVAEAYVDTVHDETKNGALSCGASILAISDAFDAMTSERPYRKAMSVETACAEIGSGKGTQFDPEVADAFLKVIRFIRSAV